MVRSSLVNLNNCRRSLPTNNPSQDITPSRTVCRNLFGPVDHRELREEIEKDKREQMEAKKKEYNFDFEKGQPLVAGRYLWEKPAVNFVKSSSCGKCCKSLMTEEDLSPEIQTISGRNSAKKEHCNMLLKGDTREQKITDFFQAKKRKHNELLEDKGDETDSMPKTLKHFKKTDITASKFDHEFHGENMTKLSSVTS